jgi:hypothetical protein
MTDGDPDADVDSPFFTYVVPLAGVVLLAVGIAAAVPGAYALIQEEITTCGAPSIAVESAAATERRFGDDPRVALARFDVEELTGAERAAVREALVDPVGEAQVQGPFPRYPAFVNGSIVTVDSQRHYATVVADNPCFEAGPLQFPLGVFAVALGGVAILAPPAYRRLVALETGR